MYLLNIIPRHYMDLNDQLHDKTVFTPNKKITKKTAPQWNFRDEVNRKKLTIHSGSAALWYSLDVQNFNIPILTYLLTYLLHANRVLVEKVTDFQLVEKLHTFNGTRMFITTFTSARHLSLSWTNSIQSILPHPTSLRSILILSSHLRLGLPKWPLSLRFPYQNPVYASLLPRTLYMHRPSHSSRFNHPNNLTFP